MAKQTINRGAIAGDGTGETLFAAFGKAISNFDELYAGRVIQAAEAAPHTTYTTLTTPRIPFDNTIPQNTEGTEIVTVTITPTSASSRLRIEFDAPVVVADNNNVTAALFQDSNADAIAAAHTADRSVPMRICYEMAAGTTSATTFKVRMGNSSGTSWLNGDSAARRYGGIAAIRLRVTEFQA